MSQIAASRKPLARSLEVSSALSEYYVPAIILPIDVIRVLNQAKIRFTLVGAHALGAWTHKPRTTDDVDVVVAARQIKRAVSTLKAAFPDLVPIDLPVVIRLSRGIGGPIVIDLLKPIQPVIAAALTEIHAVDQNRQKYRIPSIEMSLALKFAAMVSLLRGDVEKYQDASDFLAVIRANQDLSLDKLARLGELVYPGGGKELVSMVAKARAGERLMI